MGELLSRYNSNIAHDFSRVELASLISVLEVKVETALISSEDGRSGILFGGVFGAVFVAFVLGLVISYIWRQKTSHRSNSGMNLSPSADVLHHEEEKSNNIKNEENLRRYANPLKGSTTSLRGGMELSLNPAPEISTVSALTAGTSATHKSQPSLYQTSEPDFDNQLLEKTKVLHTSNRHSQILLNKTQNFDLKKNTVGSIESPRKDFSKRSLNCKSMPPVVDADVLTVHV